MKLKNMLQEYISKAFIENDYSQFETAYMERSNKETGELIAIEDGQFLKEKISYFRQHIDEFIYIESTLFESIGVDSICVEVDDVFGTFDVMLGLKLKKKQGEKIKAVLNEFLEKDRKYSLLFNQSDGLWELNFALNGLEEFHEEMEFGDVCKLIYCFLFKLVEAVEERMY